MRVTMSVLDVFAKCSEAVVQGVLIERTSRSDKEFHFQNWFARSLTALNLNHDPPKRNSTLISVWSPRRWVLN